MKKLRMLAILLAAGCGAPARTPAPVGSPDVLFSVDFATPLPLLTIKAGPEETARLKATYKDFRVETGKPVNGVTLAVPPPQGGFALPWSVYLRNFSAPYPVRLVGIRPDGAREVIREEHLSAHQ